MTSVRRLPKKEYIAFEELISSTADGRAFLRQRDAQARVIAAESVRRMMKQLMLTPQSSAGMDVPAATHVRILRKEILEISAHIQQTRNEIAQLRPEKEGEGRIELATSELDAIVSQTERATYDILNGTEKIQAAAMKLPDMPEVKPIATEIGNHAIEIMTACSFQDLTGQRITKVVNALRYIETRINAMIEIWGLEVDGKPRTPSTEKIDTRPDAHLMHGPSDDAADQTEIDSLFDSAPAPAAAQPPSAPADQSAIDAMFE
jgi:chemotaxis regulatin CheY-phosphate phosphatase CheZ